MTRLWLDANVLLRFIEGGASDQARRARSLMRRAEVDTLELVITPLAVAEVVWVLGSQHGYDRAQIREVLRGVLTSEAVAGRREQMIDALDLMADQNVDFGDAMLAVEARDAGEPVCTFDADFRRLPAQVVAP